MSIAQLRRWFAGALLALVLCGCGGSASDGQTWVALQMLDQTGTLDASQPYIMSIYDPNNENDYRFVQYSTDRSATFRDVPSGTYRAHVTSSQVEGQNSLLIDVKDGDHIRIVFTYYHYATVMIGPNSAGISIPAPLYRWRYDLSYE